MICIILKLIKIYAGQHTAQLGQKGGYLWLCVRVCACASLQYLASRKYNVTAPLEAVIKHYLCEEYMERKRSQTEETKELSE